MIELHLNPEKGVSFYRQIVQQIKHGILTKHILPEEQLPSVREMSKQLQINPLTVAKAYLELEHQKLVTTRWGKGTFVSERISSLKKDKATEYLYELIDCFIKEVSPLVDRPEDLPALIKKRLCHESH